MSSGFAVVSAPDAALDSDTGAIELVAGFFGWCIPSAETCVFSTESRLFPTGPDPAGSQRPQP